MKKRVSRKDWRERQLEAARAVSVPQMCDVAIVGGGAAGIVAAITAAERGAAVVVLERSPECGLPILATGNGRCNFANVHLNPRRFNCPKFVDAVCGPSWLDDVLTLFRTSGLRWSLEDDRLYPTSRQAASVRNVLLARARSAGVVLAPARTVISIEGRAADEPPANHPSHSHEGSFTGPTGRIQVSYQTEGVDHTEALLTSTVIFAAGGSSQALADQLGIDVSPREPVLCPIACKSSPLTALDGRRACAQVSITKDDSFFPSWTERGEVLFRNYGLSGIVIFDASRYVEKGDLIELNLAPDLSKSELQQLVDPFAHGSFKPGCLDGVLDPIIAAQLEGLARDCWHIEWTEREAPSTHSQALISLVRALPFVAEGLADTEHAQVTRGGLATREFDPTTLAAHKHPWLFACGEALDVDADCGGFNLSWAWKSAMVAGEAAAERARA